MVRTGLNRYTNNSQERRYSNTYVIAEDGYFSINNNTYTETNNDFLLSYNTVSAILALTPMPVVI